MSINIYIIVHMQYLYYLLLRYILIIAPCLARPDGVGRDMGVHLVLSVERDDDACHVDCAAISSYIFLLQLTVRGVCTVLHSKLCGAAELLVVEGQV